MLLRLRQNNMRHGALGDYAQRRLRVLLKGYDKTQQSSATAQKVNLFRTQMYLWEN